MASDADIPIPGIRPDAADDDRARAIGRLMRRIFRETTEVEVDGLKVIRLEEYNEAHRCQSFAYRVAPCGNTGLRQYRPAAIPITPRKIVLFSIKLCPLPQT